MLISIDIIGFLECSCHIWVPQLVYFDMSSKFGLHVIVYFVGPPPSDDLSSKMAPHFSLQAVTVPIGTNCILGMRKCILCSLYNAMITR
jgi:hypothetical protein